MKLKEFFIVNIVSVIGYIFFIIFVFVSSCKFYLSLDNSNIYKFITYIDVFMSKLLSLKFFIFSIFMFTVEVFVKRFFNYTNFLQKIFLKKTYDIIFYTGIFLYLTGFFISNFSLPLSFPTYSYFIIIFTLLLFLFISNPKLRINKYYSINSLLWSSLLFQVLLLLYVIIVLLFQYIFTVDGIGSLMIVLNYIFLYGIFVVIFLIHIVAFILEIILRKLNKIKEYNTVKSGKLFKITIYSSSILLSILVAYSVYLIISAFNSID